MHSQIPVLVLTGSGAPEVQQRAIELGADEYLAKPVAPADLLATIRAHLACPGRD